MKKNMNSVPGKSCFIRNNLCSVIELITIIILKLVNFPCYLKNNHIQWVEYKMLTWLWVLGSQSQCQFFQQLNFFSLFSIPTPEVI